SGINPGEMVVVRGGEALRNGVNVKVVRSLEDNMPKAPDSSGQNNQNQRSEGPKGKKPTSDNKN
ncbi:MAG: hypothetical protein ACPLRA_02920, partial [Candidatus Saccharicenans sp.]